MTKCYGQYRWDPETDDMVWDTIHSLELNFHTIGLMHLMYTIGFTASSGAYWTGYFWESNIKGKVATLEY